MQMNKCMAAILVLTGACLAQELPGPDRIKRVEEREARERRVQERIQYQLALCPCQVKAEAKAGDPRTEEQKAADKKLLDEYFANWEPTGKLVKVRFEDGAVLYVPEVRRKR